MDGWQEIWDKVRVADLEDLLLSVVVAAAIYGILTFRRWLSHRQEQRDPFVRGEAFAWLPPKAEVEDAETARFRGNAGLALLWGVLALLFQLAEIVFDLPPWPFIIFGVVCGGFALALYVWRRLNDPPEMVAAYYPKLGNIDVPREALTGMAAAMGVVALMIIGLTLFV